jgi:hypothetical protein
VESHARSVVLCRPMTPEGEPMVRMGRSGVPDWW